jgi:FAD/FMN-containing dehydrogenase
MPDQIGRTLRSLGGQLPGRVFRPSEDGYAAATAIWAKPVGPMPRAVVHCRTTEDVQSAIRAARAAIAVCRCRCGAAGTTGPVVRCAPASSLISES